MNPVKNRFLRLLLALVISVGAVSITGHAQAQDDMKNASLQVIGGTLALETYVISGYLGALADGFDKGVYDLAYLQTRIGGLRGGLGVNIEQLDNLLKQPGLSDADRKDVKNLQNVLKGLDAQAAALIGFVEGKDKAQAATFRKLRQENWDAIVNALSLGDAEPLLTPGGASLGK